MTRGEFSILEIDLTTLRGLAALHLLGVGVEAKDAFQRAYSLLDEIPQHPRRGMLLHNFGLAIAPFHGATSWGTDWRIFLIRSFAAAWCMGVSRV